MSTVDILSGPNSLELVSSLESARKYRREKSEKLHWVDFIVPGSSCLETYLNGRKAYTQITIVHAVVTALVADPSGDYLVTATALTAIDCGLVTTSGNNHPIELCFRYNPDEQSGTIDLIDRL